MKNLQRNLYLSPGQINKFTISIPEYPLMCKLQNKSGFQSKNVSLSSKCAKEYKQLIQHYMLWEIFPWRQALSEHKDGTNLFICI